MCLATQYPLNVNGVLRLQNNQETMTRMKLIIGAFMDVIKMSGLALLMTIIIGLYQHGLILIGVPKPSGDLPFITFYDYLKFFGGAFYGILAKSLIELFRKRRS